MKARTVIILVMTMLVAATFGCLDNAETRDQASVAKQQEQYGIAQPVPYFDYSLERDFATQMYEARNERVATHSVWRSISGNIEGDCPSIGYPLPYSTQLTNPLQPTNGYRAAAVISQPEPNGLYSSESSIATWVRCTYDVNGRTIEAPMYIESIVTAYPFPVNVDYESGRVIPVQGVMPSVVIEYNKTG